MSGIIGNAGSRSGKVGYVSNEWKLLYTYDFGVTNAVNITYYIGKGMEKGTFTHYKVDMSGLKLASTSAQELRLRWSTVNGATAGYAVTGYYGARWGGVHDGNHTTAGETNLTDMRIAYLNDATAGRSHHRTVIEFNNMFEGPMGVDKHSEVGVFCQSSGYLHSTSHGGYGGLTCVGTNNNEATTGQGGSGGELTCIQILNETNVNFNRGISKLYGLVK